MDRKLDIFKTLNHLNKQDRDFYKSLSEEEVKELHPLVVMRWMSGTDDAMQIILLNELVNPYVFPLHKHKELLFDSLIASSSGDPQRYQWKKVASKKTTGISNLVSLVSEYFGYNQRAAVDALPLLSDQDIIAYAEQLGKQPDELAKIKKELKQRS